MTHTRPMNYAAPRLLAIALSTLALTASADPVSEAKSALQAKDNAKAIRILDQAAKSGDVAAKGWLANVLRSLPPPDQDIKRACALALEAGNAGNGMGAVIRTECMLSGAVKVEQPWLQAKDLSKKVMSNDEASAGLVRYMGFTMDPQYSYIIDGHTDKLRYDTLAGKPMSARTDQIEAYNGLSAAMGSGLLSSYLASLNYLLTTSAPNNMKRAVNVATLIQSSGNQIPDRLTPGMQIAAATLKIGSTNAAPMVFSDAVSTVFPTAAARIQTATNTSCDASRIQPKHLVAGPIQSAVYLPIKVGPLVDSYIMSGTWTETWTLEGCGSSVDIKIAFTADGWGGAKFKTMGATEARVVPVK
jgi:hypothetical protein